MYEYTEYISHRMVPACISWDIQEGLQKQAKLLKMATGVGNLSHHLHTSKKRSFAPPPPYINYSL